MRYFLIIITVAWLSACTPGRKMAGRISSPGIGSLKFLGEFVLPNAAEFRQTIVGGLSGIDYDSRRNLYYLISDDPSTKGPTRYYTAKIDIRDTGIANVQIVDVTPLLNARGEPYADITVDRIHSADVEAIRYDSVRDEMIWTSEGQRHIRDGKQELQDPEVTIMDRQGHRIDGFVLPDNMHIRAEEKGPRHNSVFEGVTFDENNRHVYVSVEEPLYEDGPRAGLGDSTAWIRILKFNRQLKECVAQYAYKVDPVPYPANPPGAFKINGVSDILYIGDEKFLVIERAWSTGRVPSDIRVYVADAKGAEDISHQGLLANPVKRPISKKLLLDMNSLNRFTDNIEGVTFGPILSNGHRTLLFVADDNFARYQKSQFLLFEIVP
jgi:hypothetical protein